MKTFSKYFVITLILFTVLFTGVSWVYDGMEEPLPKQEEPENPDNQEETIESPYQKLFDKSNRVNFLVLGMEGPRTDTIMVASFDPDTKKVDIISIPRDTYYERNENHSAGLKKINAVYGGEGIEGIQKAASNILFGMPIDYYVRVNYDGVSKVVDSLGGVETYIPMDMKYDDDWDEPPLHIDLVKGTYELDGDQAVQFLRFRKNNDGTGYPDGDIGRIRAQQGFLKSAFKKVLSYRLPIVANTMVKYIRTDLPLSEVTKLAANAIGMSVDDLTTYSLPGDAIYNYGVSYYLHDTEKTSRIVESLYSEVIE